MKDPLEEASVDVTRRGAATLLLAIVVGLIALFVFSPGARIPLAIVFGFIVLIVLHEAGHYWAAKKSGMKVTEFFVGFGPRLWSFRRGETEYGVKAVPAGGYVRIIGMNNLEEVDPADEPRTYRQARYRNRMVTILAGVTVNILIALLLFGVVLVGKGTPEPSTTVDRVTLDSAAHVAGLQSGDEIVGIGGARVDGWEDLKSTIEANPNETLELTVERGRKVVTIDATIGERDGVGFLGVAPTEVFERVGVLEAIPQSFVQLKDVTVGTVDSITSWFSPDGVQRYTRNFTSDAPDAGSREDLERPRSVVGIVDVGSDIIDNDIWRLLFLLGGISLILALFNLLPLLPFDGGHAVVIVYEWAASKIKGRKVEADYKKLMPVAAIVLAIILTFSLSVMFLDVRQAIGQ
jgi:membrane-associated protease RseP (regulator of RpoE activity)